MILLTLNATDLLFLHQIKDKPKHVLQRYYFWSTEAQSIDQRLEHLLSAGHLHESTHLATKLSQFTIPVIKELLRAHDLKVSGNKDILLSRLHEYDGVIDLSHLQVESVYIVDESLQELMEQTRFLVYMSMNGPLTIDDAYSFYLDHPTLTNSEVIIKLHEKVIASHQNTYQVIKCHLLLSDYYDKVHYIQSKSLNHLNSFTLLIVLEAMRRYLEVTHTPEEIFFDIDNNTVEKYRSLLLMKQWTVSDLYQGLLRAGENLPYSDKAITLASQFIIRYIINSNKAEQELISGIKSGDD